MDPHATIELKAIYKNAAIYIPNEVKQQQVNTGEGISTYNSLLSLSGPKAHGF
jgi:hypothetical protein